MAILSTVPSIYGEDRELYIRLNSIESSNHGEKTNALFRGFVSKEAFDGSKHYIYECSAEFYADIEKPLWPQAYDALITQEALIATEV